MRWFVNFIILWGVFLLVIVVLQMFGVTGVWTKNLVLGTSLWFAFLALFLPTSD